MLKHSNPTPHNVETYERRAIDACDHSRATVEDRDGIWSPDGERQIGVRELIDCPDCPLSDWFEVDAKKGDE